MNPQLTHNQPTTIYPQEIQKPIQKITNKKKLLIKNEQAITVNLHRRLALSLAS
jgi:hypothetical protein